MGVFLGFIMGIFVTCGVLTTSHTRKDTWVEKQVGYPIIWNEKKERYERISPDRKEAGFKKNEVE